MFSNIGSETYHTDLFYTLTFQPHGCDKVLRYLGQMMVKLITIIALSIFSSRPLHASLLCNPVMFASHVSNLIFSPLYSFWE